MRRPTPIRLLRLSQGLSVAEVAGEAGLSKSRVAEVERQPRPTRAAAEELAAAILALAARRDLQ